MSYIVNVIKDTEENANFRTVLYTGEKSQLVLMNIVVGGEIGKETHSKVEQLLFIQSGTAKVTLGNNESEVGAGDVVVVSPGIEHNVVNAGEVPLLIYTVYAPPNLIDKRVHATKEAAEADLEDEQFGG